MRREHVDFLLQAQEPNGDHTRAQLEPVLTAEAQHGPTRRLLALLLSTQLEVLASLERVLVLLCAVGALQLQHDLSRHLDLLSRTCHVAARKTKIASEPISKCDNNLIKLDKHHAICIQSSNTRTHAAAYTKPHCYSANDQRETGKIIEFIVPIPPTRYAHASPSAITRQSTLVRHVPSS